MFPLESLSEIDRTTGSVYLLRDLIQERLGLALRDQDNIGLIIGRLADRKKHASCRSFLEYYELLKSASAAAEDEWREVMVSFAKPKSGFWRQIRFVRTLVDVVLPQLLSVSSGEPLRIWSAACSTGEEPLSIALALKEAGWFERAAIEIYASDGSYMAVKGAIEGVYCEQRIGSLDIALRNKYFTKVRDGWRVAPVLHKLIQWKVANLMSESDIAILAQSHIVSCRNVFIYFTEHAICKTLALFARQMPVGAYLFSDGGEFFMGLVSSTNCFQPLETSESGLWIRRDANAYQGSGMSGPQRQPSLRS